jgi:hypothetical protein
VNTPFQIELATGEGAYDSKKNGGEYAGLKVLDILLMEPSSEPKEGAPWVIPSSYRESDARTHDVQKKNGKYWLLTADIDVGNIQLIKIKEVLESLFGYDQLIRIYSTGSAKPDCLKWRVLIPLDRPLEATRWQFWQRSLNAWLIKNGITPDTALERFGQLVYLPNIPKSHRKTDGSPIHYQNVLFGNDLLTESSCQVWADWLAEQTTIAQLHEQAAKVLLDERMAKPKRAKGASVIYEFNKNYSIDSLLLEYGYHASPNKRDWRSPYQKSKTFATRCWGDYWTSLSTSDKNSGLGVSSEFGCSGDAFSLFVHFDHGGDVTKAIKELTQ